IPTASPFFLENSLLSLSLRDQMLIAAGATSSLLTLSHYLCLSLSLALSLPLQLSFYLSIYLAHLLTLHNYCLIHFIHFLWFVRTGISCLIANLFSEVLF